MQAANDEDIAAVNTGHLSCVSIVCVTCAVINEKTHTLKDWLCNQNKSLKHHKAQLLYYISLGISDFFYVSCLSRNLLSFIIVA